MATRPSSPTRRKRAASDVARWLSVPNSERKPSISRKTTPGAAFSTRGENESATSIAASVAERSSSALGQRMTN
jgi:hypothetical protein